LVSLVLFKENKVRNLTQSEIEQISSGVAPIVIGIGAVAAGTITSGAFAYTNGVSAGGVAAAGVLGGVSGAFGAISIGTTGITSAIWGANALGVRGMSMLPGLNNNSPQGNPNNSLQWFPQ
jgi:lactobin A/cerein 7B family class IIb bacteriocin